MAAWIISNGIGVVQVNPYVVKQSKEIEDNSQLKDDREDPKLIANLVKDGNYGMPYLPEKIYADMRRLSMFSDQLTEDRIRNINRLHRELKIYFPEYMDAFGKIDGAFALEVLKVSSIPSDITELGAEGIRNIWHDAKLRGRGYSRAGEIVSYAEKSVGLTDGTDAGRKAVKWFAEEILKLDEQLAQTESLLHEKCMEIPYAENILEINGVDENILAGILAEMRDISRFSDVKEIQKLSGMGLVACACSSGKHKGADQDQSQRTQAASVLAVSGGTIRGFACRRIQTTACVLHNTSQQSTKKDAVIDCDSLQDTKGDIHHLKTGTTYALRPSGTGPEEPFLRKSILRHINGRSGPEKRKRIFLTLKLWKHLNTN